MTKLEKPITIIIEHVENAVHILLLGEFVADRFSESDLDPHHQRINRRIAKCEIDNQIKHQLNERGINYKTWEPPAPLLIGNHEVVALPDGAIKVGCTTVDRATLEKVYAMSNDSMAKVEPEWPKFTRSHSGGVLEFHKDHSKSVWREGGNCEPIRIFTSYENAIEGGHEPITATQAAAILKGAK